LRTPGSGMTKLTLRRRAQSRKNTFFQDFGGKVRNRIRHFRSAARNFSPRQKIGSRGRFPGFPRFPRIPEFLPPRQKIGSRGRFPGFPRFPRIPGFLPPEAFSRASRTPNFGHFWAPGEGSGGPENGHFRGLGGPEMAISDPSRDPLFPEKRNRQRKLSKKTRNYARGFPRG